MASGYGNPPPQQPVPQGPFSNPGLLSGAQGMFGGLRRGFQAGGQALHPYSNRLLLAGMGMLSHDGDAMGQAMKGLVAGSALDAEDADRTKLNKALQELMSSDSNLIPDDPAIRGLMAADDKFAEATLLQRMKPADFPGSYDEWTLAQNNPAYAAFLKNRPAGTSISLAGENAYSKTVGEGFAKDYIGIQQGARDASGTIGRLDRLGQALSAPGVYTGTGGELVADLKKAASGLGIDVAGVAETDTARAISNEITLQLRNPAGGAGLPGAMSDADRQFLAAIPPGLSNTPEGNRQKLDMLKKVQQRNIDVAQFANQYVQSSQNGQLDAGFYQALAEWSKANPLFPEGDTPAELDALKREFGIQ